MRKDLFEEFCVLRRTVADGAVVCYKSLESEADEVSVGTSYNAASILARAAVNHRSDRSGSHIGSTARNIVQYERSSTARSSHSRALCTSPIPVRAENIERVEVVELVAGAR